MQFHKHILNLDCVKESARLCAFIQQYARDYKRDGAVIGLSGGIDSALSASLCVRALGKDNVLGLIMPEKESSPVSAQYALKHAKELGIWTEEVDITPVLEAFGTYEKRENVVKSLFPGFDASCRFKIALPADILAKDAFNFFTLKVIDAQGEVKTARLNSDQIRTIVAATDSKQRTRMMHLYYHAEKNNYFVCGTTNKPEAMQGLFVKYGDGGVDIEPLEHLYKDQVYQLAGHLGVIGEIMDRAPSPDTFSFTVTDEEFFFRMPYDKLDLLLYAWEHKVDVSVVCGIMGLAEEQVKRVFRDFSGKYSASKHLRRLPVTLAEGNSHAG